jgi:RNA polymerase sigma-70 factor, ECF subfamily
MNSGSPRVSLRRPGFDQQLRPGRRPTICATHANVLTATTTPTISMVTPDATLVRESQAGDHAAFEELVHRYDQAVLRLALRLTGSQSEAQDVYQEAFLKAYRNLRRFRFECSFYTWMYRIVTNLCLDHLRNRHIRREDPAVAFNADGEEYDRLNHVADSYPGVNPEHALLVRELRLRIDCALKKLTPRERIVFELKHYQGLRLRAVGEILNTTEETIKSTLFRATQKLRTILADTR